MIMLWSMSLAAQDPINENRKTPSVYVGYDLGEMAFNGFQNFAGELGLKFRNDHTIRFVYMNVKLTEKHLSSNVAKAVDGENVTGLWHGYEVLYDLPLYRFKGGNGFIYGGVSGGYHENTYQHTILNEFVEHKSGTVGFDLGYRESNLFKVEGLYFNFQVPFRYYFTPLEEKALGESIVNKSVFGQTISFFVGYEF